MAAHSANTLSPLIPKMADTETLRKELEQQRAANKKAAQQAEEMQLRNELEAEKLKQKEWEEEGAGLAQT